MSRIAAERPTNPCLACMLHHAARPFIAHDWSFTGHCVNCGLPEAGAPPECVPTTAEPEVGE